MGSRYGDVPLAPMNDPCDTVIAMSQGSFNQSEQAGRNMLLPRHTLCQTLVGRIGEQQMNTMTQKDQNERTLKGLEQINRILQKHQQTLIAMHNNMCVAMDMNEESAEDQLESTTNREEEILTHAERYSDRADATIIKHLESKSDSIVAAHTTKFIESSNRIGTLETRYTTLRELCEARHSTAIELIRDFDQSLINMETELRESIRRDFVTNTEAMTKWTHKLLENKMEDGIVIDPSIDRKIEDLRAHSLQERQQLEAEITQRIRTLETRIDTLRTY